MQNNELKNTVDTILTNLKSDPINDVISTKKEELYNLYIEYVGNLVLAFETSLFKICTIIKKKDNLNYNTVNELVTPLVTDFIKKLIENKIEDTYTIKTINRLIRMNDYNMNEIISIIKRILFLVYKNLRRDVLDITNSEKYIETVEDQINDIQNLNKLDILKIIIDRKVDKNIFDFKLKSTDNNLK